MSKGSVKVTVYKPGTASDDPELDNKVLISKEMGAGSGFGELALLYNDKRSATIEAKELCKTYTLDRTIFKGLIIKSSIEKRSRKAEFLNQIKLFDQLDKFQKLKLVDGLQTVTLSKEDFVLKEGEAGEDFFIIEQGQVDCLKLHRRGNKVGLLLVRTLGTGEHFGELALINNEARSLSIKVRSEKVSLLRLDRDTFIRLLGSIEKNLKKDYDHELDKKLAKMKADKRTFS